ncbi:hypothetical protein [Meiothermus cerbereus]|uniref:hypothetical protein n=1 Tax=Meiothermus cerbereus TaxID=65552 RepID=UPI003EE919E5
MSKKQTFLLQLWQDQSGVWVVLKDEQCGLLHQFESLEALSQFLSRIGENSSEHSEIKEAPVVNSE